LIRRFRPEDADALADYRSDPRNARYQSWTTPVTRDEAVALAAHFRAGDPAEPGWFQYAVEARDTGTIIGDVGVDRHANGMQAEIGFTLARDWHGRGYASEAVTRVLDHLFFDLGLHRVSAECDARNVASARLLERLGFRREGLRRSHTWIKGEWTDDLLFGVLADEWHLAAVDRPGGGDHADGQRQR
jgi:aminoglycoside 6'-N-acetyltransferase